jgi:hypothetical protein
MQLLKDLKTWLKKKPTKEALDERWVQSLALLYQACEPLTYDCKWREEDLKKQRDEIREATFQCYFIKEAIEKEIKASEVEEETPTTIEPINVREFSDELTEMFRGKRF